MSANDRYWDSTAFIAFLKPEPERVDACEAVIDAAKSGAFRIITSTLTFSEVVHVRGREKMNASMEDTLRGFFEHPFIVPVTLTRAVSEHARELMWRHSHLRPYDANHLASAYFAGVHTVDSYDDDFLKLNGTFAAADGSLIRIGHPDLPVQTKLDLS